MPPRAGDPVLIEPRPEDPLDFLTLDIVDTFEFSATPGKGSRSAKRAKYTCTTLHLNDRDYLPVARKGAYKNYLAHLHRYVNLERDGAPPARFQEQVLVVRGMDHPSVWAEMKRQSRRISELHRLFEKAPEALNG